MSHIASLPGVRIVVCGPTVPVTPYSVACERSPAFEIVRFTLPVFVTVIICAFVVLPTSTLPNASELGLTDACCAIPHITIATLSALLSVSLVIVTIAVCEPAAPAGGEQRTGIVLLGGIVKLVSEQLVWPTTQPPPLPNENQLLDCVITAVVAVSVPISVGAVFVTVTLFVTTLPSTTALNAMSVTPMTAFVPVPDSVTIFDGVTGSVLAIVTVALRGPGADGFIVIVHPAELPAVIVAGNAGPPVIVKSPACMPASVNELTIRFWPVSPAFEIVSDCEFVDTTAMSFQRVAANPSGLGVEITGATPVPRTLNVPTMVVVPAV